jgi:predicted amidohydrolase
MRVAAVQHDIAWEDAPATREQLRPQIAVAAAAGASLIVLSEMFATGFSMNLDRVAEEPGGENERFLIEQAGAHGCWLLGSIAQWSPRPGPDGRRRGANVAVLASPDGEVHRYQKIHPFSFAGEDEHYEPGEQFLTVLVEGVRVTIFICYDLRFADEFWRCAPGTDLFVVPANWPQARREHWSALLAARAIENQAYVLGCNRVGSAEGLEHSGDSVIIDPMGRVLAQASVVETVLTAEVEAAEVQRVRGRFPFLADRR